MKSFTFALLAAAVSASESVGYGLGGYGGYGGYGSSKGYGGYAKVDYVPHTQVVQKQARAEAASKGYGQDYTKKHTTDWDAYGRDQDLAIDESYGNTSAKSYRAESYDEWDNEDKDDHGAQAWGRDQDKFGASSQEYDASRDDYDKAGQAYAAQAAGHYGKAKGYGHAAHGHVIGHGHGKGWGKQPVAHGYGHAAHGKVAAHGSYGKVAQAEAYAAQDKMKASW